MRKNFINRLFTSVAAFALIPIMGFSHFSSADATVCVCSECELCNLELMPGRIADKGPLQETDHSGLKEYSQPGAGSKNDCKEISDSKPDNGFKQVAIWSTNNYNFGICTFKGTTPPFCVENNNYLERLINQWVYHRRESTLTFVDHPVWMTTYIPSESHVHVDPPKKKEVTKSSQKKRSGKKKKKKSTDKKENSSNPTSKIRKKNSKSTDRNKIRRNEKQYGDNRDKNNNIGIKPGASKTKPTKYEIPNQVKLTMAIASGSASKTKGTKCRPLKFGTTLPLTIAPTMKQKV